MKIVELSPQHENLYFLCLEDWSEEMKEAGSHKQRWYQDMKDKGLRVKLAQDDNGQIGGMIQYLPIEQTHVEGQDLYFVHCIWVHGYKKGRGNFQKKGMGKALLRQAEEDAAALGAKGLAVWGISLPFFMRASWFKKRGYKIADKNGMIILLWKPFAKDAEPPKWIKQKKKPAPVPGKVTVSAFINGWCPGQNLAFERAKKAAVEFGEKVLFKEYHTGDKEVFSEWGMTDTLYVDHREIRTGPPPSYAKIRKIIATRVKKLKVH